MPRTDPSHGPEHGCRDETRDHDHDVFDSNPVCADCGRYLDPDTACGGLDALDCGRAQARRERGVAARERAADAQRDWLTASERQSPSAYAISGYNLRTGAQLPTFYLLADVQGIVDVDHAERIAHSIVPDADVNLHVIATRLTRLPAALIRHRVSVARHSARTHDEPVAKHLEIEP